MKAQERAALLGVALSFFVHASVVAAPHHGGGGMGGPMSRPPVDDPDAWVTPSEWETDPERLCYPLTARLQRGERVSSEALDDCHAEAASRLARRVAAAPTLRWEDVSAIPPSYRLPEERARYAELDGAPPPIPRAVSYEERREQRRERDARRRDVRWILPAWSAAYCTYVDLGAQAKRAGTGREQDYARSMKTIVLTLRNLGVAPLSCRDPRTVQVRRCMDAGAHCSSDVLDVVALVPTIYK